MGPLVSSCGFTSFEKYKQGDLSGWSKLTYMPRIASIYHKSPAAMPFDFSEVLGTLAPRAVSSVRPLRTQILKFPASMTASAGRCPFTCKSFALTSLLTQGHNPTSFWIAG